MLTNKQIEEQAKRKQAMEQFLAKGGQIVKVTPNMIARMRQEIQDKLDNLPNGERYRQQAKLLGTDTVVGGWDIDEYLPG